LCFSPAWIYPARGAPHIIVPPPRSKCCARVSVSLSLTVWAVRGCAAAQALPQAYLHNGSVDITTPATVRGGSVTGAKIFPKIMVAHETLDVDTLDDLERCK
jgi:hypothetical protein